MRCWLPAVEMEGDKGYLMVGLVSTLVVDCDDSNAFLIEQGMQRHAGYSENILRVCYKLRVYLDLQAEKHGNEVLESLSDVCYRAAKGDYGYVGATISR